MSEKNVKTNNGTKANNAVTVTTEERKGGLKNYISRKWNNFIEDWDDKTTLEKAWWIGKRALLIGGSVFLGKKLLSKDEGEDSDDSDEVFIEAEGTVSDDCEEESDMTVE